MSLSRALANAQTHTIERVGLLELPRNARTLLSELRRVLIEGVNQHKMRTTVAEVLGRLALSDPPERISKDLGVAGLRTGAMCIFGGEKNQNRETAIPHFMRDDEAWFDFSITLRETEARLELLAYDFEIRAVPNLVAPFLRFDLNLPGHANDERELRCHLHPGSDDVLVPAPVLGPIELLHFFLDGLRFDREAARTRSTFELVWVRTMASAADKI